MTKMMLTCALIGAAGLASAASARDTLAEWTFQTSAPVTAGPHTAEGGVNALISQATGSHAGASTYSSPAGNGSNRSFSSTNWVTGDYYQFKTSATGYEALTISWDQTGSSTGPRDFQLQWSTDGTTFTPFFDYSVLLNGGSPNAAWNGTTYIAAYTTGPMSLPASFDNQANVYVRMVQRTSTSLSGGTVGTGGTDRVDNVRIEGDLIPAPGAAALLGLGGLLAARRRRA